MNRIPRKLLASSRLILLWSMCRTRSTEFRANVPLRKNSNQNWFNLHRHWRWHHLAVRPVQWLTQWRTSYLVNSLSALCDTLHQLNLVKSAMWDESNLVMLLWLMSSTSTSRKFLNWFRFNVTNRLPCKSSVFNFLSDCKKYYRFSIKIQSVLSEFTHLKRLRL